MLSFATLALEALVVPQRSGELFPLDSSFCLPVCTKPLCLVWVPPSFLGSTAEVVWRDRVEGVVEAVWSVFTEHILCPAETVWLLTPGSLSLITFSEDPFEFTSALLDSLIGTSLAGLITGLAGVEANAGGAVDDNGGGCNDRDDDEGGDGAVDAVCLDLIWMVSNAELCTLAVPHAAGLVLPCCTAATSTFPLGASPLPCLW